MKNSKAKIENIKVFIKPINDMVAFHKGVQYFTEFTLLYGFFLGFTIYEIRRNWNIHYNRIANLQSAIANTKE